MALKPGPRQCRGFGSRDPRGFESSEKPDTQAEPSSAHQTPAVRGDELIMNILEGGELPSKEALFAKKKE